jgi:hypothetical protein
VILGGFGWGDEDRGKGTGGGNHMFTLLMT